MNQQRRPIKEFIIITKSIKTEKLIVNSTGTSNREKRNNRETSRVPIPIIEIGRRAMNPTIVTDTAK